MITYREAQINEAENIAIIHLKTFKNFFLSTLGKGFLTVYYKSCIKSKNAISICALDDNNNIIGFCFGAYESKGFHKNLILNNFITFTIQALKIIFSNSKAIIRLFKNLNKEANENDDGDYAELLSIGVLDNMKGLGIGKGLLLEFEKKVKEKKIQQISLTTDYQDNKAVLNFYKSLGYYNFYEFKAYPNRKMYKLIKKI